MVKEHGLPVNSIQEIDCDSEIAREVTSVPTIQICEQTIVGLPEEDTLDRALWKLRVNQCFHENQKVKA